MSRRAGAGACKGSALIELLLVVSLITMMIGLMLPALTAGREAARRSQCCNNFRQIMLALQNYEYSCGLLPSGVVDRKGPIDSQGEGLHIGWIPQLLPFLEQRYVYETIDFEVSVDAPENNTAAQTRFHTFHCPSDPRAEQGRPRASSSYAGCHHDVEAPIDVDNHGVFFLNSRIRSEDVRDGTSATIFVGEKRIDPARDRGWMSGTSSTLRNTGTAINAIEEPGTNPPRVGGFSSDHRAGADLGGANFGFGDGSVRWIRQGIAPRVYRLLGHRDDGEPIDARAF